LLGQNETQAFRNPLIKDILRLDADEEKVVATTDNGDILVMSADDGTVQASITGHRKDIEALAIFPKTTHAVTGSWHKDIKLWDLDNGTEYRIVPFNQTNASQNFV